MHKKVTNLGVPCFDPQKQQTFCLRFTPSPVTGATDKSRRCIKASAKKSRHNSPVQPGGWIETGKSKVALLHLIAIYMVYWCVEPIACFDPHSVTCFEVLSSLRCPPLLCWNVTMSSQWNIETFVRRPSTNRCFRGSTSSWVVKSSQIRHSFRIYMFLYFFYSSCQAPAKKT